MRLKSESKYVINRKYIQNPIIRDIECIHGILGICIYQWIKLKILCEDNLVIKKQFLEFDFTRSEKFIPFSKFEEIFNFFLETGLLYKDDKDYIRVTEFNDFEEQIQIVSKEAYKRSIARWRIHPNIVEEKSNELNIDLEDKPLSPAQRCEARFTKFTDENYLFSQFINKLNFHLDEDFEQEFNYCCNLVKIICKLDDSAFKQLLVKNYMNTNAFEHLMKLQLETKAPSDLYINTENPIIANISSIIKNTQYDFKITECIKYIFNNYKEMYEKFAICELSQDVVKFRSKFTDIYNSFKSSIKSKIIVE